MYINLSMTCVANKEFVEHIEKNNSDKTLKRKDIEFRICMREI